MTTQPIPASFQATWEFMPALKPVLVSRTERVKQIVSEMLRGLVVFWLLAQLLRPIIRAALLPAAWMHFTDSGLEFFNPRIPPPDRALLPRHQRVSVDTPDGATLDVLVVRQRPTPDLATPVPCVLVFNPNGASYVIYSEGHPLLNIARRTEAAVDFVFFDYRGVNKSTGQMVDERDLVVDGASVLEFVETTLRPSRIDWAGHSLGGNVSLLTRAATNRLTDRGVHLCDRAPASIHAVLRAKLWLFGRFLGYLASLGGFELLAGNYFNEIRGNKLATWDEEDTVIAPESSIAHAADFDKTKTIELVAPDFAHMFPLCLSQRAIPRIQQLFGWH